MASTPSSKPTKLSPHPAVPGTQSLGRGGPRTPLRGRLISEWQSRLSLRRVVGTTCCSPTGFDSVASSFAYIAGGAVVVVDVVDVGSKRPASSIEKPPPDTLEEPNPTIDGPDRLTELENDQDDDTTAEIGRQEDENGIGGANETGDGDDAMDTTLPSGHSNDAPMTLPPRQTYTQRFFRARPTAVPVHSVSPVQGTPSGMTSSVPATPRASDTRNRAAPAGLRDISFNPISQGGVPTGRTWTSRERIKAATCLSLSRDGRFLAVGETGYAPRVLIFGLQDASSSDVPLVSISEHTFGVQAVAWSADTRYLASLGAANDGFIYVWSIDHRTGAAKLFQQNRCTSTVRGMAWMGNLLITLGVRHMKAWRVDDPQQSSPTRAKFVDSSVLKPLPGRNVILGSLIEATFTCAAVVDDNKAIVCTDAGDVCLLDNSTKQMKLSNVLSLEFPISSITIREGTAFVGGKSGQFATLLVEAIVDLNADTSVLTKTEACTGVIALAFLSNNLVTVDCSHSIDIWDPAYRPGQSRDSVAHIPIPGHSEPILGVQSLDRSNPMGAAFVTWAGSGRITAWGLDGSIRSQLDIPVEQSVWASEMGLVNQLTCVRATRDGGCLVAADRLGTLRIVDPMSNQCLLDTKAHSAECQSISIYEGGSRCLVASCGRDRTAQLFHKTSDGVYEHFQTLEFTSKVVQVLIPSHDRVITCALDRTIQLFDLVSKEGEPDVLAAISTRVITFKSAPTSMVLGPGARTVFVSMVDRSVAQYDLATGKQVSTFKCNDESSAETAVLESLSILPSRSREKDLLVGVSNTDKSVRIYDALTGEFLDREWGHTEAINGVALADDQDGTPRVVSVGSDGTVMIWAIDSEGTPSPTAASRDSSPTREGATPSTARQPLRRVLSKQELAEFQKSVSSPGRRSPPRSLRHKVSRTNLAAAAKTPTMPMVTTPLPSLDDTPIRSAGPGMGNNSPPESPSAMRHPSLASLATATVVTRKKSSSNLRGASSSGNLSMGSMNVASDQICRTLRTLRKRIATSSEPMGADALDELEQELRLTAAAIGDRNKRNNRQAMSETALTGLLDMYSERIMSMLDERLSLGIQAGGKAAIDDTDKESSDLDAEPESPIGDGRHCVCIGDEVIRASLPSPSPST